MVSWCQIWLGTSRFVGPFIIRGTKILDIPKIPTGTNFVCGIFFSWILRSQTCNHYFLQQDHQPWSALSQAAQIDAHLLRKKVTKLEEFSSSLVSASRSSGLGISWCYRSLGSSHGPAISWQAFVGITWQADIRNKSKIIIFCYCFVFCCWGFDLPIHRNTFKGVETHLFPPQTLLFHLDWLNGCWPGSDDLLQCRSVCWWVISKYFFTIVGVTDDCFTVKLTTNA